MRRLPRLRFRLPSFLALVGAFALLCAWFNYQYVVPERRLHAALVAPSAWAKNAGITVDRRRNNLSWADRIAEWMLVKLTGDASSVTASACGFQAWDDNGLAEFEKIPQLERIEQIATGWIIASPEPSAISDAGVYHLRNFKHLRLLRFRHGTALVIGTRMRITDASMKYIAGMRKLEALNLSDTMITDAGIDEIVKLARLRFLALNHTDISDAGIEKLTKLPNLEILEFFQTKATEAVVDSLARMPKLRAAYHSTTFSYEAFEKLQAAHPALESIQTDWDAHPLRVLESP